MLVIWFRENDNDWVGPPMCLRIEGLEKAKRVWDRLAQAGFAMMSARP